MVVLAVVVAMLVWRPWGNIWGGSDEPSTTTAPAPGPSTDLPPDPPSSSDPSPTEPDPSESASDQVAAVDERPTASAAPRRKGSVAVSHLQTCTADSSDADVLAQGTTDREGLVSQLDDLSVDALPDGDQMREDLDDAWRLSAEADQRYLDALNEVEDRCTSATLQNSSAYRKATALSGKATAAKKDFVELWNPVAESYGLQTRENTEI